MLETIVFLALVVLIGWVCLWMEFRERRFAERSASSLRCLLANSEATRYKADRMRCEAESALATESRALHTVAASFRDYRIQVRHFSEDVVKALAALKLPVPDFPAETPSL